MNLPKKKPFIFINYRRKDAIDIAQLLYKNLEEMFGADSVFVDLGNIESGKQWSNELQHALQKTTCMLVLVGKQWLFAQDEESGEQRIRQPHDWVRKEIECGLQQGDTVVIPVILGEAKLPKREHLPESMQGLCDCQTFRMDSQTWKKDVHALYNCLEEYGFARQQNRDQSSMISRQKVIEVHPFLLQQRAFIGRSSQLDLLDEWLVDSQNGVMVLSGLGGSGKSALAWNWYQKLRAKSHAGTLCWWRFEAASEFDGFLRSIADVKEDGLHDWKHATAREKLTKVLASLREKPWTIILDGADSLFYGYDMQRTSSAKEALREALDEAYIVHVRNRELIEPIMASFFQALALQSSCKLLLTSRTFPADLEAEDKRPIAGVGHTDLNALPLRDSEVVQIWRTFGGRGSDATVVKISQIVGNHALMVKLLACAVSLDRRCNGDLDQWIAEYGDPFNPNSKSIATAKQRILGNTLEALSVDARKVLSVIAVFAVPVSYRKLFEVMHRHTQFFTHERLDASLDHLEELGVLTRNRGDDASYQIHPIVQLAAAETEEKSEIQKSILVTTPVDPIDWRKIDVQAGQLNDLIGEYQNLVSMGQYDMAIVHFANRLNDVIYFGLDAHDLRLRLISPLFERALAGNLELSHILELSPFSHVSYLAYFMNASAQCAMHRGDVDASARLFQMTLAICEQDENSLLNRAIVHRNFAMCCRYRGVMIEAERCARNSIRYAQQSKITAEELESIGEWVQVLATRGEFELAQSALQDWAVASERVALEQAGIWLELNRSQPEQANSFLGSISGDHPQKEAARNRIYASRVYGALLGRSGQLREAEQRLESSLRDARKKGLVLEEQLTVCELCELFCWQGEWERLTDALQSSVFELPCRSVLARWLNLSAELAFRQGKEADALELARQAYVSSWCDGSDYAFHSQLQVASRLLKALGSNPPILPSVSPGSMPEIPMPNNSK